ncbi:MAG: C10 family peptidase [Salinivirgaceae bacterium]|nr:C10 family peptidase [Salinivirgaceae bacterium]
MKKIVILILSILISGYANSEPIGVLFARQIAENVIGGNTLKSTSALELKHVGVYNGDTLYYIFAAADGGFAIISADDAVQPVLGYSKTSPVCEVSANKLFAGQLDRYAEIISIKKKSNMRSRRVLNAWRMFAESDSVVIDSVPVDSVLVDTVLVDTIPVDTIVAVDTIKPIQLITSTWGQDSPYMDSCPTYVGCVAVAMGQIMRYHKWPEKGRGWHKYIPSENPEYGWLSANFGATTYEWDFMPDRLRSRSSLVEKRAVQQMLYHVGVAVNMSYTEEGSGSSEYIAAMALCTYFNYNHETMKVCAADEYTADDWIALIKSEIDAGRPVLYAGMSSDEGHAWVVDGYDANDYLHVNWGWDGDFDGYFAPDNLLLETSLYSTDNTAVIGIQPATDVPMLWTMQSSGFSTDYRGITNISAIDNLTAWAAAYDGEQGGQCMDFCRTIDGGESWEGKSIKISGYKNYSISMISAVSANEAWAAVYVCTNSRTLKGGKILHTTDAGESWEIQASASFSGSKAFPNIVHFWDSHNGVCIGDPNDGYFEIYTTTDGGANWKRVPSSNIPANKTDETGIVAYYSVAGNNVFFCTTKGRLYRSSDRGATWTVVQTPLTDCFILAFRNAKTGVIKGMKNDKFLAYQTFDGGDSWNELGAQPNFYPSGVAYIPNTDTLISVGGYIDTDVKYNGISYSVDDGRTFTDFADIYRYLDLYTAVGVSPDGKGVWAGAYGIDKYYGGMYHRGDLPFNLHNTDISDYKADTDSQVSVYPNPTTDYFMLSGADKADVVIYNALGNIVLRVGNCMAGNPIDVSKLPTGLYVIRVQSDIKVSALRLVVE